MDIDVDREIRLSHPLVQALLPEPGPLGAGADGIVALGTAALSVTTLAATVVTVTAPGGATGSISR